jgi:Protein of unknown function (DUF2786)
MASVLERVQKLLALAASPNAHEARNAAYLAAKLIREHDLELREPPARPRRPSPAPRRSTPKETSVRAPHSANRTASSKRGVHAVKEAPARIESPLGGDCIACGKRYRAGADIFWLDSEGGFHSACFDAWAKRYARRN